MSLPTQLRPAEEILKLFHYAPAITTALLFLAGEAAAAVLVEADTRVDTYLLLHEKLGGTPYEVPDCGHSEFGPHITQTFDDELRKDVFLFHLHRDHDDDRCIVQDRQRTEVKTYSRNTPHLIGSYGEDHSYRWKFRFDGKFQPSSNFTHFFQIKPVGNEETGTNPLLTFSANTRDGKDYFRINHDRGNGMEVLYETELAPLLGTWIEAQVDVHYTEKGTIAIVLKRISDNSYVLELRQQDIALWRPGTEYNRPKFGLYRSLLDRDSLRDEVVRIADICITENGVPCLRRVTPTPIQWSIMMLPDYSVINPFPTGAFIDPTGLLKRTKAIRGSVQAPPEGRTIKTAQKQKNESSSRLKDNPFRPKQKDHVK